MSEMSSQELVTKIRNELIVTAKSVKDGKLTPNVGNAVANIYRTALTAEQTLLQAEGIDVNIKSAELELSEKDRRKLDKVARLLSGEDLAKKKGRKTKSPE